MEATKRMERLKFVRSKKVLIGIDIGSRVHYVKAITSSQIHPPFPISNDSEGFKTLTSFIKTSLRVSPGQILVAFEPTGPFWEPLAQFLDTNGYSWVFVSAISTHRIKDISDNSPNKTDMKDCGVILELLNQGHYLKHPCRPGIYRDLLNLAKFRYQLANLKRIYTGQLFSLLAIYFPELSTIFHSMHAKTIGTLLMQYQTPQDIKEAGYDGVFKILKKRWRNPAVKIKEILRVAKNSVGVRDGIESYRLQVKNLIMQTNQVNEQMKMVEAKISGLLDKIPEIRNVRNIKGAGDYTLGMVLGYFGRFDNYRNAYELMKYAGLNLFESSSGLRKGQRHMSKRGPGQLRQALYMMAMRMIMYNPVIKRKYKKYAKMKGSKIKSLFAVMCYIVRLLYALIRDQKEFDPKILKKQLAA